MDETKNKTADQITPGEETPLETQSPVAPKTEPKDLPPLKADKKADEPFFKKLRRGSDQFSAMPKEQKFTEPPATPPVANTPLPTQPLANTAQDLELKPKKFITPLKLTILILLLLAMGLITVSATLVATEFTIYEPPLPIKNFLENIFSGTFG